MYDHADTGLAFDDSTITAQVRTKLTGSAFEPGQHRGQHHQGVVTLAGKSPTRGQVRGRARDAVRQGSQEGNNKPPGLEPAQAVKTGGFPRGGDPVGRAPALVCRQDLPLDSPRDDRKLTSNTRHPLPGLAVAKEHGEDGSGHAHSGRAGALRRGSFHRRRRTDGRRRHALAQVAHLRASPKRRLWRSSGA